MNNRWLGFLIPKVQVVVPSMDDVAYLHRRKVFIYELKKHPGGYQITVRKGVLKHLDVQYSHPRTRSIYPSLGKFALPVLAVFFAMMALMQRYTIGYVISGNSTPEQRLEIELIVSPHFYILGPFEFLLTDNDQIEAAIKEHFDEYIWVEASRQGNNVNIEVFHTSNNRVQTEPGYSFGLHASRSGMIRKVNVKTGRALVSPGQMVRAGDRLITSTVLDPTGSNVEIPTHKTVSGEVLAETWYLAEVTFPQHYVETMLTTRMDTRRVLHLGSQSWQFPGSDVEYGDFTTRVRRIDPFFFLENSPLFLETIHYYEKSDIMKVNDLEEIKQNAASLIKNQFAEQTDKEFELLDLQILEQGVLENQVSLLFHVTILENIAY
ncbi:MAG: sporulation protein YqfD [Turicibacter sp.]|nr:sporulation protein YqfD [Turicibacter sp.]